MRITRDSLSPPGFPPGRALRPLCSSANDLPISPPLLAGGQNQVSTTRRGAISGRHMAQLPTANLLFASTWEQGKEVSLQDECLEPGTMCLWCFPCEGNDSDFSSHSIMTFHQAPAQNPARALAFGEFEGYTMAPPTNLEGDTLVDLDMGEKESVPVSPKTIVTSTDLLNRFASSYEPSIATIRPSPSQVLPPSTRHLHSQSTTDGGCSFTGYTRNHTSRPRFAGQTTIDHPPANDPIWTLKIGESREPAYRFKQEELKTWAARAWALNIAKHGSSNANNPGDASVLDLSHLGLGIKSNDANHQQHSHCNSLGIQSLDDNTFKSLQVRNLLSTSSSLPILSESTSSCSGADRLRDFSVTTGTGTIGTRDSSGSYMSSSPPIKVGPAAQWHRTSFDRTAVGQYYQSTNYDPSASAWHHKFATEESQAQQQQQQQPSLPSRSSPARVTDIFSVRPLATRRPFEPARYLDSGPHSHLASHPLVLLDDNFSRPLTTSATLPNVPNVQGYIRNGGLRGAMPRSQTASEAGAEDSKNTCLWLEGLPASITYAELTSSIKNCGRIYSTYINPPIAHHQTSAAKLAFFTRAGAERLHAQATKDELLIRNQRIFVRWNRNAYIENLRHGSSATRILLIRGPKKWVNETTLTSYFTSLFWSNICRIDEVPMALAASWVGSDWLENGEEAKVSLPEKFREFAAMRWEFASFHSQASSAKTAIESETAFGGLIKVNFLPDPCDYTSSG